MSIDYKGPEDQTELSDSEAGGIAGGGGHGNQGG